MDWSTLAEAAPELLIGFGMLVAIAWFRKQDRQQLVAMHAELSGSADDVEVTATGRHRAVVVPWELLGERFDDLAKKVDAEIAESREFRESTAQRVTALETDVRWLRRGNKSHADTLDSGRKG